MNAEMLGMQADAAIAGGTRMTLVRVKGRRMPQGFPRGELLCENHSGRDVYSYSPEKVKAWLTKHAAELNEVAP